MIYVLLADGFEEVEALAPVDILRRAHFEVRTVGVTGKTVHGSHGIAVTADLEIDQAEKERMTAVVLPGGMPGTINLEKDARVQQLIDFAAEKGLLIGAICAAPSILGHKGLLRGKDAVCFTGFEKELTGARVLNVPAVRDGNIVTGWGAGGALDFGFELLAALSDRKTADSLRRSMRYAGMEKRGYNGDV